MKLTSLSLTTNNAPAPKLKNLFRLLLIASIVLGGIAASAQSNLVYVVTMQQQFGTVDLSSGVFQPIGPPTPEPVANLVWGPGGALYTITVSGNLDTINPLTGVVTVVGATGLGYNAFDLVGVNGKLYATDFSNSIYSVDPTSGLATLVGPTGMPADPAVPFSVNGDGTINLCDESLYSYAGKLYGTFDAFMLDPNTLTDTTVVGANLYQIDPTTGSTTVVGPTQMNIGATVDMAGTFYAFHLMQSGPVLSSQVETLDLSTGKTTFVINVDPAAGAIFGVAPVRGRR